MDESRTWTIDPETLRFSENDARPEHGYTRAEFDAMDPPPCPTCGTPVDVTAIPTPDLGSRETRYIPGRWRCPRSCH